MASDDGPGLPRRREPDLAGLAAFTLDATGRIASWSVTATRLFGRDAGEVAGRGVCDALMTGPGQRDLVRHALAEVAAGRVCTVTMAGGDLGDGRFTFRWEPVGSPRGRGEGGQPHGGQPHGGQPGSPQANSPQAASQPGDAQPGGAQANSPLAGSVLVIAQRAWPHPAPNWLTEAAAHIGSTLDLARTAAEVVGVAVPGFADMAIIYGAERMIAADEFVSPRGEHGAVLRRLAARQTGRDASVTDVVLRPDEVLVIAEDTPAARAMATGEPVEFDRLDRDAAERISRRPGGSEFLADYDSYLVLPLIARGVVVGCVLFGRAPASPAFSPAEVALAGELASRAAVCIDNARLYHREHRTALALQRGLLPGSSKVPAGMEVAQRVLPVGASVLGGDWHDIVPLSGGSAALIVGDAMGHGPEAAAVMVQLRTAAHILADQELPPQEVLSRLDRLASGMPGGLFATCIYTVIDPAGGSCVVALAGHLPPVLVFPDGLTHVPSLPPGMPLGLGEESFEATTISLPPGTTLALYTDGLVESRSRPLDDGTAALREALGSALAEPGAVLGAACAKVTEALREHGEDDITLVLARVRA
jgi:hypothetical protein